MIIIRYNNTIITDWFNKPTSSGRLINFCSDHPEQQRINIIYNHVDRAISLSNKQFHKKNLNIVIQILQDNNYSREFINRYIHTRQCKIKHKSQHKDTFTHNRFTAHSSLLFTDQFDKIASILKPFNFRVLPLVKKSFNSILKLGKNDADKWDETNVVYKFTCKSCPASYVGVTKCALKTRINEHRKNNNPEAVVYQHITNFSHEFGWNNVKSRALTSTVCVLHNTLTSK